jgi:biotin-[acetyl-CoA-carboxylase] ligase BirA-like protein
VQLGMIARGRGVRLLSLDEVDSTSDEARRLIETGERGPLWIVAAQQTKGRGRLGRDWISPRGNLYASLIVGDVTEARVAPQLGFVAGVAGLRALRATTGLQSFQLKWPNDLLFDREKLGGILLECVNGGAAPVAIIGVGVNIATAPHDLPYRARALGELGAKAPSIQTYFEHFSDAMVEALDLWRRDDNFSRIREEWLASAAGVGERIRVTLSSGALVGRYDGIDASGRLILDTDDGRRAIEAGDVLLGPRATEGARL